MFGYGSDVHSTDRRETERKLRQQETRRIARAEAAHRRQTERECRAKPREHSRQYQQCSAGGYHAIAHREAHPADEVVEYDRHAYASLFIHLEGPGKDLYAEDN